MKKFLTILLLLALVVPVTAQSLEELLQDGDSFQKEHQFKVALEIYEKADSLHPANWKVMWRLSRAYVDLGDLMPAETDEQKEAQLPMYEKAVMYADSAVALAPNQMLPYLRRAIANGKIALFKGVFSVGSVVDQVRDDSEKAIELNTSTEKDLGIAHYVLARTHDKISDKWGPARSVLGLGWADWEIAIQHYQQAQQLYPELMMIHLDYAKAWMEEDEWENAKAELVKAQQCKLIDKGDQERVKEIEELLVKVNEELD